MIEVIQVNRPAELQQVFAIREEVFVKEQHVRSEDEYDEFEKISHHFLAYFDGTPCGTARWRTTSYGIKLERFAVLAAFRGKGVGQELVRTVLEDVFSQQPEPIESVYLNAQITAMPLYARFGFKAVGPMFEECGIQHYKMVLPASSFPA
ncbi:GNAT family N-acetyltransferase [Larkinella terrae]|uniref:GNAT family N-acetyltransferase n=1 Tax=Larkinella terrae TaxID=2025311 RepID=A0A7K0ELS6_9BACT|nr:GNAT family N-acetyltransferase [Larkinella terrae]MRS62672.1 GNAT family N-acetyltransferase [Larkinella terrae]